MYHQNQAIKNILLFNGAEQELLKAQFTIMPDDKTAITFSADDFADNPLESIKEKISKSAFNSILKQTGFTKRRGISNQYVNRNHFPLYFFLQQSSELQAKHLVIVSFGEVSPGHFTIFFEALFEKDQ